MRVRALTVAAVAVAGLSLAACDPAATSTTSTKTAAAPAQSKAAPPVASTPAAAPAADEAAKDVEVLGCAVDATLHWPSADVKITNHSSKSSNYIVNMEFTDASGTRVAEGLAATNNLAAGQAANVKAAGTAAVEGKVSCKVTKVTRYAAP